jgi:voltage-gated potassium channel
MFLSFFLQGRSIKNYRSLAGHQEKVLIQNLERQGADNVIMPDKIGGSHMATLVSKPDVIEFMDFLSSEDGESVNMESVPYDLLPPTIKDKPLK